MRVPRLFYVSSKGDRFSLDGPKTYVGTALPVRGRKWSYEMGRRSITSASMAVREVELETWFTSQDEAASLMRAADRDMFDLTPGRMEGVGGWFQRAFITSSDLSLSYHGLSKATLGVALLDGVWRRAETIELMPGGSISDGKGYPHAYPYSYGSPDGVSRIESMGSLPGPVSIVFYGPVTNPSVTIGGNRFAVDCSVPSGGYLEVDGINLSVTLCNEYGERSNRIADAVRGGGKGSGEYIFEEVGGGGEVLISWSGGFGATVTYWHQEMELPMRIGGV